jgi:phage shock protein E
MTKVLNWRTLCYIPLLLATIGFGSSTQAEAIWIDVRSVAEHKNDHIEGDIRITHVDIIEQVNLFYPDKTSEIRLYCRSGGRAEKAMSALKEAGYTNVTNVGGIEDARSERDLTQQ